MTRRALAIVAAALALSGCTIIRDYVWTDLRADPHEVLIPGVTTIAEVLETFGSPNRIQRRRGGEILVYHFTRGNSSQLEIQEPVFTGISLFTYSKRQLKANRLTLFFDDAGTLTSYGYTRGVEDLEWL